MFNLPGHKTTWTLDSAETLDGYPNKNTFSDTRKKRKRAGDDGKRERGELPLFPLPIVLHAPRGFIVWDPYRAFQKSWLEQVQRGAARFVTRTYTREEGWTNALKLLNWPILEKKRQVAKLTLMYKCRCWYLLVCTSSVFPKNQSISSTEMWHVQIRTASGRELSWL